MCIIVYKCIKVQQKYPNSFPMISVTALNHWSNPKNLIECKNHVMFESNSLVYSFKCMPIYTTAQESQTLFQSVHNLHTNKMYLFSLYSSLVFNKIKIDLIDLYCLQSCLRAVWRLHRLIACFLIHLHRSPCARRYKVDMYTEK